MTRGWREDLFGNCLVANFRPISRSLVSKERTYVRFAGMVRTGDFPEWPPFLLLRYSAAAKQSHSHTESYMLARYLRIYLQEFSNIRWHRARRYRRSSSRSRRTGLWLTCRIKTSGVSADAFPHRPLCHSLLHLHLHPQLQYQPYHQREGHLH